MADFNDPDYPGQWQLRGGSGVNIASLYDEYTGHGIRIGLIDTQPSAGNVELQGQIDWSASVVATGANVANTGGLHGHGVAKILVAKANNGVGAVGAAFGATLVSYTVDAAGTRKVAQEAQMLALQKQVDISQNSWSHSGAFFRDDFGKAAYAASAAAVASAAAEGRGGLGTIIVRSAGNTGEMGDDVNAHNYANNRYSIAIGATDEKGAVQAFSNTGAALLAVAPGTGTSYSSPLVSATVALMLEANPHLGYRDVQTILAMSARLTDTAGVGWFTNKAGGWNGGGMHVSNEAGFGLIDAHAAVRLAESWSLQSTTANLQEVSARRTQGLIIADQGHVSQSVTIASDLSVERAEVTIVLRHELMGDLRVWLVSPSGTQSVLLDRIGNGTYDATGNVLSYTLSSVQFLGEAARGNWTLHVQDMAAGNTGTLVRWSLALVGAAASADTQHVYTDEFATLAAADPSRAVLADATGEDTLNGAALTAAARIDLSGATASQIAGKALRFATGTVIEHAIGGDGDDVLIGNGLANHLQGGRGADRLEGGAGNDTLEGGAGHDTLVGGSGADTLRGGAGDDLYSVEHAGDVVVELPGAGTDKVISSINYRLPDHVENLALTGAARTGVGNDLANTINGTAAANELRGGAGDDVLQGLEGNDTLVGGSGNDMLRGGAGADVMQGGVGNDIYVVDDPGDQVVEVQYQGYDTVRSFLDYTLPSWTEYLELYGNALSGTGTAAGNILTGNERGNTLSGLGGNDILRGLAGNDVLLGGEGADRLEGGAGQDMLRGDAGADVFVFTPGGGRDVVVDFTPAEGDRLLLAGFGTLPPGDLLAATHAEGQDLILQLGNDVLVLRGFGDSMLPVDNIFFS
ncbi:S8 family serine peptidase [Roseomonas sp. GC11]|uniref:S8 family serine peptidase n=1 Tax=Roseomonas sp. GC11 TaxID=2950546 RepID=UPI00210A422F|nr:S8 family serine peptidase [Roseomonas sp. GC11]MCQ4162060.1 S8 family serine peptidase [Roseomonas sp. GC11]